MLCKTIRNFLRNHPGKIKRIFKFIILIQNVTLYLSHCLLAVIGPVLNKPLDA